MRSPDRMHKPVSSAYMPTIVKVKYQSYVHSSGVHLPVSLFPRPRMPFNPVFPNRNVESALKFPSSIGMVPAHAAFATKQLITVTA